MQVKHILREKSPEIVSIAAEATLSEAARLLWRKRIGALIVRDGQGALLGIVSERDLVRAVAEESVTALARPVSAYMTRDVATCGENDTVDELMEMMTQGRFRHVPVLSADDRLIGIVSIGDVVKSRIEETVREATTLRQYISAAG
ncbi:MAG: CBS domain-containing protein [Alphaproteobacteria bacterium]|nr:CBS domain-containing protein [Alphaproteobacteria bacterium]MBV9692288.1 CBS domain-containing protein [Alphaproteobacteria bacterium]